MTRQDWRGFARISALLAALATSATLGGCFGGDSDGTSASGPPISVGPALPDGTADLPATGGSVSIALAASPIFGAKIEAEDNALDGAERVAIAYEDNLPAALNAESLALGGKQISKVLVLTPQRPGRLRQGRHGDAAVRQGGRCAATPCPSSWRGTTPARSYAPVTVRAVDRTAGTMTFMTAHFGKFVAVVLDKLFDTTPPATSALTTDTQFRPGVDGFYDRNFGSYDTPGGNSFGMAGYAAWYHAAKKATRGAGLFTLYGEGTVAEEDDVTARELITRAYQAGDQKAHLQALNWMKDLNALTRAAGDAFTAYSIIQQLVVTKQAQLMVLGVGAFSSWSKGNAVTVYAYDGTRKVFQFYDNNYPGEVVELPWDPAAGFTTYTVKNVTWDLFAFASFNQAYSTATLAALFDGAEAGWPVGKYPKISIAVPTELPTAKGVYEVASEDNVSVSGVVSRAAGASATAQRYMHVYVNGQKSGNAVSVANSNDAFTVNIAKLPSATGTDVDAAGVRIARFVARRVHLVQAVQAARGQPVLLQEPGVRNRQLCRLGE